MANMNEKARRDRDAGSDVQSSGGEQADYGGMDQNFDRVDLARANEVGADPPGGLGTDIGGGSGEIGADDTASGAANDLPSA